MGARKFTKFIAKYDPVSRFFHPIALHVQSIWELENSPNLVNDGAKWNRLLYLKIMYTAVRKILHLQ